MLPRIAALALLLSCSSAAAQSTSSPPPAGELAAPNLTSRGRILLAASAIGVWSAELPSVFILDHTGMLLGMGELLYFVRDRLAFGVAASGGSGVARTDLAPGGAAQIRRGDHDLALQARALFDVPISAQFSLFVDGGLGWALNMATGASIAPGFGGGTTISEHSERRSQ